jgi:hypothetical protein
LPLPNLVLPIDTISEHETTPGRANSNALFMLILPI